MADSTNAQGRLTEDVRITSAATRSALEKLAAPQAVSIMEEMLRVAAECNNNNNNNNNDNSNGGSGCAARAGLNREELLQKLNASMSDDQLHAILKQQGIL